MPLPMGKFTSLTIPCGSSSVEINIELHAIPHQLDCAKLVRGVFSLLQSTSSLLNFDTVALKTPTC